MLCSTSLHEQIRTFNRSFELVCKPQMHCGALASTLQSKRATLKRLKTKPANSSAMTPACALHNQTRAPRRHAPKHAPSQPIMPPRAFAAPVASSSVGGA